MKPFANILSKINNHKMAWLFAFCFGVLTLSPTILSIYNIGFENFRGVYPMFIDDESHYLARAKEAADGYMNQGNVFISEHKDYPGVLYGLTENIVGFISLETGVSVPAIFAANDFFFPIVGFLALYFLFFAVTKNKKSALIYSATFYALFLYWFGRPVAPQFNFIFLAVGLRLVWKIFETETPPAHVSLLLSLCMGLLVYLHLFYWTPIFVLYALVVFFSAVRQKSLAPFKNSFVTFFTFGAVITPYVIIMSRVVSHPLYPETIERWGMLNNHYPAAYINVAMLAVAFFIVLLNRNHLTNQNLIFAIALPISGVICNWQNVITGKYLQFSSHYYLVAILLVFVTLAVVFPSIQSIKKNTIADREKNSFKTKFLTGASMALAVILVAFIVYRLSSVFTRGLTVRVDETAMMELQSYRPIFDWLNENTKPDSVILVLDKKLVEYVPVYTKNNLYSYGYAGYYLASDEEVEDRWVRQNIFNAVDAEYIRTHRPEIWSNRFIDAYQNASVRNKIISKITGRTAPEPELLPEIYVDRVLSNYNEAKKEDLKTALKKFELDYVLLDRKSEESGGIEKKMQKEKFAEPVKEFGGIVIYKVN